MHKLNRSPDTPAILDMFDHTIHTWDDFSTENKKAVWVKLYEMQGNRCAYCEKTINPEDKDDRHIEHFRRKGVEQYQHLTFEWTNLFGSCCVRDRCGIFKDKQKYEEHNLIKMDDEDPEKFFTFLSTGKISINDNLSAADREKAQVTLRVFNLNPDRNGIKTERLRMIASHEYLVREMIKLINELTSERDMDLLNYVLDEYLEKISGQPFETAIKHILIANFKSSIYK
ncbi:retron Ec78 anti-phage system effector HNH endonuclease PtuB [Yersinia enterocolitica]|uniref:retron Ec78 anti-phage system effector HNH endonuclease PtuB n=1 Tax=Yersinia enterocolitica TaxID=630 RepID=UPI000D9D7883|nr:retron Ec78 anti-phage system effector HNH endonuclease PtuB [Yersinia enterocolitica]SQA35827.1 Uncharacterised protein [Yersinia enterocolitica]SUP63141.1 Uncharacterised protein [Yersinia enterocolitica]